MHYKNKKQAQVGDWVIGPTHNSQQKLVVGIVVELTPLQGDCNVKLAVFGDAECPYGLVPKGDPYKNIFTDYADAKNLVPIVDAYRLVEAVYEHGLHESSYNMYQRSMAPFHAAAD